MNQLYNLKKDEQELKNHADNPEYKEILANMKKMLSQELKTFNRPYGEFVAGGNAVPYERQNDLEENIAKAVVSLKKERAIKKAMERKKKEKKQ